MIQLLDIQYVRLSTKNIEKTTDFATRILGLELSRTENNQVYFRSDSKEHSLCLFESSETRHICAFSLATEHELEAAYDFLKQKKITVRHGSDAECLDRRVARFIHFYDLSGNEIELVWRPESSGWRYFPSRDAGITGFSHIGLCSTDTKRDEKFWTELFSARVSDWIGPSPLLRIDEIHHKIALFPTTKAGIQHINHQVAEIDDIMRSWYFLQEQGIKVVFGPGRHPTSGACFLYFEGPDEMVYEYSCNVSKITNETAHRPRQFPLEPKGFCSWGSKPQIKEFQK